MKKKIIFSLLVIITLFTITACGKQEEVDETLFKVNNLEFHLDKESEFKNIKYTISSDFKEVIQDMYIQYNYYQEDNTNLLFYRVFYYENKDINYAINDLDLGENINLTDGKINDIDYKYYPEPRDDGGTIHFYFINKNDDLYVLNFISKYDIKDFEAKVLNTIKF